MSLRTRPGHHPTHPLALEFGVVTAALGAVYLWHRLLSALTGPLTALFEGAPRVGGFPLTGLAISGTFLLGLALFVLVYARARGIDLSLATPEAADAHLVALAAMAPLALVGLTKAVGVLTGVRYSSLTMTYLSADPPLLPVLTIFGLGILVGVPSLVLICQVLVQGTFDRVLPAREAVALTTVVAGFVLMSNTGGLATTPELGKLVGAGLFAVVLGVALYADDRVEGDHLRALVYLPVVLFVALVVFSALATVGSVADGLFGLAHLAVLSIAALAHERTDSLVLPGLAYLSLSLANAAVLLLFESGGSSPF